jgi:hypothetical protein
MYTYRLALTDTVSYTRCTLPITLCILCILCYFKLQIGNNLKYWPQEEEVVDKTLALFLDMASSYSSSKLLLGLDTVKFLLQHHGEEHFPFLSVAGNTRHRTTFHLTLARLIFTTTEELQPLFEAFVAPLTATLAQLGAAASFRQESVKRAIIGVCRGMFVCAYNILQSVYLHHVVVYIAHNTTVRMKRSALFCIQLFLHLVVLYIAPMQLCA